MNQHTISLGRQWHYPDLRSSNSLLHSTIRRLDKSGGLTTNLQPRESSLKHSTNTMLRPGGLRLTFQSMKPCILIVGTSGSNCIIQVNLGSMVFCFVVCVMPLRITVTTCYGKLENQTILRRMI